MIGVIAEEKDKVFVEEFFELFKTPWELARRDRQYPVLLIASDVEDFVDAPVIIQYRSGKSGLDELNGIRLAETSDEPLLRWRNGDLPIYGRAVTLEVQGDVILERNGVRQAVGVRIGKRDRVLYRFGFDLFREVAYLLHTGQPPHHALIPTLDLHIQLLRECILSAGFPVVEIPPVPAQHTFIACLTHDVDFAGIRRHRLDRTMFGFLYRALFGSLFRALKGDLSWGKLWKNWLAAASLPLVYLGVARDFMDPFDRYVEIEGDLPSTFFFIPFKNSPGHLPGGDAPRGRAVKYEVGDIGTPVETLMSKGKEVALHGLDAWLDADAGREELKRIRDACTGASAGVRMHWLYFAVQSPAILEEAGFAYDATSGYNEAVGYRVGTAQVFRLLGTQRLLELPLHVMDTALFLPARMALTQADAHAIVGKLMEDVSAYGGALTLNWHCRSLGPERFWDDFYSRMLSEMKVRGAWFGTAEQVVRWFAKRRSVNFHSVRGVGGELDIDLSCDPGDEGPDLVLRIYASDREARGKHGTEPVVATRDIPIRGNFRQKVSAG